MSVFSDIEILYESDDVLIVNKPAGVMVHADGHSNEPTVVDWFLERVPGARGVGEPGVSPQGVPLERSGVVHRLDRETSGVLLLAKTQAAHAHCKQQFHDRLAQKEYRAFVYGTMKEERGTIDRPIGRSAKDFRLRSAQRGAKGRLRDAVTDWELVAQNDDYAYLKLFPKTGRTHQLRVHLKAIGRPVVGDTLYAPKDKQNENALGINRLALHAYALTLTLPNGEAMTVTAPLPSDFVRAAGMIGAA